MQSVLHYIAFHGLCVALHILHLRIGRRDIVLHFIAFHGLCVAVLHLRIGRRDFVLHYIASEGRSEGHCNALCCSVASELGRRIGGRRAIVLQYIAFEDL